MLSQSKGVAWYLPAINDLETIFNVAFKDLGLLNQGVYWSSTDAGSGRMKSYYFDAINSREIEYSHYGNGAYSLAVRSF